MAASRFVTGSLNPFLEQTSHEQFYQYSNRLHSATYNGLVSSEGSQPKFLSQ